MDEKFIQLAVLIDADNTSPSYIRDILNEINSIGEAVVKRVYGDFTLSNLTQWTNVSNQFALQPVQQNAYAKGKNSSDIRLVIDAMDLYYTHKFDGFCFVTSDSDFTSLCINFREKGMKVYGFGEEKTPLSFRNACHKFTIVNVINSPASVTVNNSDNTSNNDQIAGQDIAGVLDLIDRAIENYSSYANEAHLLSKVGTLVRRMDPSFDPRIYGYKKFIDLLKAFPDKYIISGQGGHVNVRMV